MYAVGVFKSGLIPPIGAAAPAMPPLASRHGAAGQSADPARLGKVNPKGGVLPVPCVKTGGVDDPAKKVGRISPGGLPRNCSCTLADVSQLAYTPNPLRTIQSPLPPTSQATPARGLYALGELLSACGVGRATPFATCSSKLPPLPR